MDTIAPEMPYGKIYPYRTVYKAAPNCLSRCCP
jgi:hypothetical protein